MRRRPVHGRLKLSRSGLAPAALASATCAARLVSMKLASFEVKGRASYGVVVGDGIVDLGPRVGNRYLSLRAVLAADALDEVAASAGAKPDVRLSDVRLLP